MAEGELITLEVWDDAPAPETDKPDTTEPDKTEPDKTEPDKTEKTEEPKPEKTEKPDQGKPEDPGGGKPTDELTQGAPADPAAATGPGGSARQQPGQGTEQSGSGKGD